ncbi:Rz1-like lysis system protein LysC [Paracoccus beibuensis]
MIRAVLLLIAASLAACARVENQERVVRIPTPVSPPAALLRCHGAPVPPSGAITQADVAAYVLDLSEAGEDCRSKLDAVRGYIADTLKQGAQ